MTPSQTETDGAAAVVKHGPSMFTNALSNWFPLATNILIGLLLTPFLIAKLGQKDYGVWTLVISLVGYYGLLRLSVGTGIMRYVPFYAGQDDHEAASQIVCTGLAMFFAVAVMILLVSAVMAGPVARFYQGGRELTVLIYIMGVAAAVECPMRIFDAVLRARERWVVANCVAVINAIAHALGLVACLHLGYGLLEMGYVFAATNLITLCLCVAAMLHLCPEIHLSMGLVKGRHLRDLFTFGILTVIGTVAYSLALANHKLIVGKLISFEAVAVYAVATQLIEKVRQTVWAPLQVAWPRFALLDGQSNHEGIVRLFHRTTRYSSVLASGIILVVLLAGPSFIRLWVGQGFEASCPVLVILAVGCLVESTLYVNNSFLGGTGRQGVQAILASTEAIGGFVLSVALGRRVGLVGVAWGFTISVILFRGVICTCYVCRLLKMNLIDYYVRTLLRPWLILGIIAAAGYVLGVQTYGSRWISWLVLAGILMGLYVAGAFLLVLDRHERNAVLETARRMALRGQILMVIRKQTM